MFARLAALTIVSMFILGFLTACGGDKKPGDKKPTDTASVSDKEEAAAASSAGVTGGSGEERELTWEALEADDFAAAAPLSDDEMPPLRSPGDRPVTRASAEEGRDFGFREVDGEGLSELFGDPAATADYEERAADRLADVFSDPLREGGERSRPRFDDDEFAAAPPVPLTDAVAPLPDEETPEHRDITPAEGEVAMADETLVSVATALPVADPFWPRFHGLAGDNKSSDTGLLKEWPDDGPALVWTATGIGYGYSSISIADGRIFTAGNKDEKTVVSAIDLDGNVEWQIENGAAWKASYEGTRGTPTIDGDRVYHQSPVGNVVCLNAEKGEEIWGRNSLEAAGGKNITWALAESLLIDGDHVICCPGGRQASMVALDKMTGNTVWEAESTNDQAGYSSPTLTEHGGLRMIFVMTSDAVIGVNADTGQLLFRHPFKTQYRVNVLKPIFHDGHLFVSGGYGTTGSQLLKLNVDGETVSVDLVWESKDLDNHHGGVMLLDGYLYGAAHKFNNAKWICLDWASGDLQWAERGVGKGSLTMADGLFYLLSERSQAALAKASPEGLEVISSFRLPPGGSGASWAHPVVSGGRLYIRHADRLFAYDVRSGG